LYASAALDRAVFWRIVPFPLKNFRDDGDRSVVLVSHDAARQVLARQLTPLGVKRVAVAVVRRAWEHLHPPVVFEPTQLTVVRDVAPQQVSSLAAPGGPLCPES